MAEKESYLTLKTIYTDPDPPSQQTRTAPRVVTNAYEPYRMQPTGVNED